MKTFTNVPFDVLNMSDILVTCTKWKTHHFHAAPNTIDDWFVQYVIAYLLNSTYMILRWCLWFQGVLASSASVFEMLNRLAFSHNTTLLYQHHRLYKMDLMRDSPSRVQSQSHFPWCKQFLPGKTGIPDGLGPLRNGSRQTLELKRHVHPKCIEHLPVLC